MSCSDLVLGFQNNSSNNNNGNHSNDNDKEQDLGLLDGFEDFDARSQQAPLRVQSSGFRKLDTKTRRSAARSKHVSLTRSRQTHRPEYLNFGSK